MSDLEILIKEENQPVPVTVFVLDGWLNMGSSDQLAKVINDAYNRGSRNMILDLSRVVSLTSAGLRVILQTYKLLGLDNQDSVDNSEINRQPGAPVISPFLKLIIPPPPVSDVLRIAGFERLMEIHSTLESALTSY